MNIDALADLLKSRGCTEVCYFHTDHFEPWSHTIDETSARAVDRFATLARSSPYARRLSLFYSVFVPYRHLSDGPVKDGDAGVPDDQVIFGTRSLRQEKWAHDAIHPLVAADRHEIHLHVHHEYWTRNNSHFDQPVSKWVNAHSTATADSQRMDLHFKLCKDAISREIRRPFEQWAFIHGNWALNASDPSICCINDEMSMILRHGGYGDFSFPAGRSYCDPKLETPFTCLPLHLPRAYDDPRADARPIGRNSDAIRPHRFIVWNSPIKSKFSSLDYYSAANRKLFETPEAVVAAWLGKSVSLGRKLYIKTHAHSMSREYRLNESDSTIPHCYPDIVAVFDCLLRVCERAGIELHFQSVNDVVNQLALLDRGSELVRAAPPPEINVSAVVPPPAAVSTVAGELLELHREWLTSGGSLLPPDDLYVAKIARGSALEKYELRLVDDIVARYAPEDTQIVEIGAGWAGLMIILARLGYTASGFEGNAHRHAAGEWHIERQVRLFPALADRLDLRPLGHFPETFSDDIFRRPLKVCVATNIIGTYSADHQHAFIEAARSFDEMILDLGRFGINRDDQQERAALLRTIEEAHFEPVERLHFNPPHEFWRFSRVKTSPLDESPSTIVSPPSSALQSQQEILAQRKEGYRTSDFYIQKMRSALEWQEYERIYDSFISWIPDEATVMIDAGCSIGQYLAIARRRPTHRWRRLIGLDLSLAYVEHMRAEGFESYTFDLDQDDLSVILRPGTADFIVFSEVFAEVERPRDVQRKLIEARSPGGRLFFTTRRNGQATQAHHSGETISIAGSGIEEMAQLLECRLLSVATDPTRYYVILER